MIITPEIEAKWRDEFIAWFSEEYRVHIEFDGNSVMAPLHNGRSQGRTVSLVANVAWTTWRKSRESVVIELPAPLEFDAGYEDEPGLHYWPTQIKNAIESHGYRVKGES